MREEHIAALTETTQQYKGSGPERTTPNNDTEQADGHEPRTEADYSLAGPEE